MKELQEVFPRWWTPVANSDTRPDEHLTDRNDDGPDGYLRAVVTYTNAGPRYGRNLEKKP